MKAVGTVLQATDFSMKRAAVDKDHMLSRPTRLLGYDG